jgi:hypothetical protein
MVQLGSQAHPIRIFFCRQKAFITDVEGWHRYMWCALVRSFGRTAKFSKMMLEEAYGREISSEFYCNSSGEHSCSKHANCTRYLWHCATKLHILEWPFIRILCIWNISGLLFQLMKHGTNILRIFMFLFCVYIHHHSKVWGHLEMSLNYIENIHKISDKMNRKYSQDIDKVTKMIFN